MAEKKKLNQGEIRCTPCLKMMLTDVKRWSKPVETGSAAGLGLRAQTRQVAKPPRFLMNNFMKLRTEQPNGVLNAHGKRHPRKSRHTGHGTRPLRASDISNLRA